MPLKFSKHVNARAPTEVQLRELYSHCLSVNTTREGDCIYLKRSMTRESLDIILRKLFLEAFTYMGQFVPSYLKFWWMFCVKRRLKVIEDPGLPSGADFIDKSVSSGKGRQLSHLYVGMSAPLSPFLCFLFTLIRYL